jgi:hypothetical protein
MGQTVQKSGMGIISAQVGVGAVELQKRPLFSLFDVFLFPPLGAKSGLLTSNTPQTYDY